VKFHHLVVKLFVEETHRGNTCSYTYTRTCTHTQNFFNIRTKTGISTIC